MSKSDDELKKLIELATAPSKPGEEEPELTEAERFVISKGIKEGTTKIPLFLLWYTYKNWAAKPISQYKFFQQIQKLFKHRRNGDGRYFLLNPEPFDLSLDSYFKIRRQLRDERERYKKYGRKAD